MRVIMIVYYTLIIVYTLHMLSVHCTGVAKFHVLDSVEEFTVDSRINYLAIIYYIKETLHTSQRGIDSSHQLVYY